MDLSPHLGFAGRLADQASVILLERFGRAQAQVKPDGSLVTEADLAADRAIRQAIRGQYPDHGILSEEIAQTFQGDEYTWVIDPLDGTTNYANGLVYWGISIALLREGTPVLALLDFPTLRQRFTALQGCGAYLANRRLGVQMPKKPHDNLFLTTDSRSYRYLDVKTALKPRILGSAAYDLVAVAAGTAVASLETTPKVWDLAAAWLIVAEAGGVMRNLFHGPTLFPLQPGQDYNGRVYPVLAAATPELWQTLRAGVSLKPGTERIVERLRSAGWQVESSPSQPARSLG